MFDQNEFRKYAIKHQGISSNTFDNYAKYINNAIPTNLTPYILEERPMHAQALDVFSRLMMDRIIFMGEPINDYVANIVTAQLLFLESADRNRDIQMYLNSPGGSVYAGLGIYDTMQIVNPDIATICTGMAASMAAVLMCAGTPGKRTALQHSRIMLHQPSSAIGGQATDIAITVREIQRVKDNLYSIITEHTGQPYEKVAKDCERDYWMLAEEAKAYGIVDEVLQRNPKKARNTEK
ncbi:MAG: ATP-dependent Clp protease proteolytic subunit [Bacteroidetes bacterium 47-18]|nr:MAG: ATP-dependent Clp protease proteolytic subunit [Bacteroidetes bacterium 47-18]